MNIKKIFPVNGEQLCEFVLGAQSASQFPKNHQAEFAFIGASNVGKSSLINALVRQKIAITSNMPGRTRQINFFSQANRITIADMPGYGFARVPKHLMENWQKTSIEYFINRVQLKRVFLLIDAAKGLKADDVDIINFFNELPLNFQIVITKSDKIKLHDLELTKQKILDQIKFWPQAHKEIIICSSKQNQGLEEIRKQIISCL